MFLFLVAALSMTLPEARPAESLAHCFVEAVTQRDLGALARIVAPDTAESQDFTWLVTRLEPYDCVSPRAYEVATESAGGDAMTLLVTIDATAMTAGPVRTPLRFPRRWYLEAARHGAEWRIEKAYVAERAVAKRLLSPPSPAALAEAAQAPGVDLELLLGEVAAAASRSWIPGKEPLLLAARELARSHGLADHEVSLLHVLTNETRRWAEPYQKSERYADEAIAIAEGGRLPDSIALAHLTAGRIQGLQGRKEAAMQHYVTAAAMLERSRDARPSLKALFMHGVLLMGRGAMRDALLVSAPVADSERLGWMEGPCATAMLRGDAYMALRDLDTALAHAREALRCSERLGDQRVLTMARHNLAGLERATGNHARAAAMRSLVLQDDVENHNPGVFAATTLDYADALAQEGRYAEAERELLAALRKAREAFEHRLRASVLEKLARVRLLDGRPEAALQPAEEADAILRNEVGSVALGMDPLDAAWRIRGTLGSALRANGRTAEAIETLQSAIELVEAQRAALGIDDLTLSAYMSDKARPYRELVALLVDAERLQEAVIVAERLRARALGQAMARGTVERLPAMSADDRRRHDALNEAIATANRKLLVAGKDERNTALRAELGEHRQALRQFLFDLYARRPDIRRRNVDDPRTILEDGARLLPRQDEALLTFAIGEEETFAFLLERGDDGGTRISVHRAGLAQAELERGVRKFVAQVEGLGLDYGSDARRLFRQLLGPFGERVASRRLLYIVPDGILWRLPFQALQDGQGRHLIERVALAYAPSLALLRNEGSPRPAPAATGQLLALADPILPLKTRAAVGTTYRKELVPLPEARVEARTIAGYYEDSRVLIGAEATEAAAKELAAGFRILHVATHGIIDDAAPMYSALLLTASGADDGLLEAREMIDLQLGADLAILSACESGGGGLATGEGVIGMSWALMVAGCRNTVVSQWDVASNSTAKLMIAFHRALSRGGDYAAALREAQLGLMAGERFRHPFYWSPFVLISTSQ